MEYRVLGPLLVEDSGGNTVRVGRLRERLLLCVLANAVPEPASLELCEEAMWPDDELPADPRRALRTYISRLRSALRAAVPDSDLIARAGAGYKLLATRSQIDAHRFTDLVDDGMTASSAGVRQQAFAAARRMWRGDPFGEFAEVPALAPSAARLRELYHAALVGWAQASLEVERADRLIPELELLLESHPLSEDLWGCLMLALYRAGRQADALRAFQRARGRLGQELGIEPGRRLARLEEAILLQDDALEPPRPPWPPEASAALWGRQRELAEISALIGRHRLVTVVGSPGVGKSRLVRAALDQVAHLAPDGAWIVDLASAQSAMVIQRIAAQVIGVPPDGPEPKHLLLDFLAQKTSILVLEDFDRVRDQVGRAARYLLSNNPRQRIVATGARPLALGGEEVYTLDPLATKPHTGEASEAARFFLAAAQRVRPRLEVDAATVVAAERIGELSDGLPLALELAASHCRTLSPAELAAELADHPELLAGGDPSGPERHRTMFAALDWSWGLLPPHLQDTLAHASMFESSFTAADVAEVQGTAGHDTVVHLLELAERSLAYRDYLARGPVPRFRLLSTVRGFAARRLQESGRLEQARERQLELLVRISRSVANSVMYGDPDEGALEMSLVVADIQPVLRWALEERPAGAASLAVGLGFYWVRMLQQHIGVRQLERVVGAYREPTSLRADLLLAASINAIEQRDLGAENVSFSHPFTRWREPRRLDPDRARLSRLGVDWAQEAVDLFTRAGSAHRRATALMSLAVGLATHGELDRAIDLGSEAMDVLGNSASWPAVASRIEYANLLLARSEFGETERHCRIALVQTVERDDDAQTVWALDTLGRLARAQCRHEDAAAHYAEALSIFRQSERVGPSGAGILYKELGFLHLSMSKEGMADGFFAKALSKFRECGSARGTAGARVGQAIAAHTRHDDARAADLFDEAAAISRRIGDNDLLAFVLATRGMSLVMAGDLASGSAHCLRALEIIDDGEPVTIATALEGLALAESLRSRLVASAALLGAAHAFRQRVLSPRPAWFISADAEAQLAEGMGEPQFHRHSRRGAQLSLDELRRLARSLG